MDLTTSREFSVLSDLMRSSSTNNFKDFASVLRSEERGGKDEREIDILLF
jgi:hypothetical protein